MRVLHWQRYEPLFEERQCGVCRSVEEFRDHLGLCGFQRCGGCGTLLARQGAERSEGEEVIDVL